MIYKYMFLVRDRVWLKMGKDHIYMLWLWSQLFHKMWETLTNELQLLSYLNRSIWDEGEMGTCLCGCFKYLVYCVISTATKTNFLFTFNIPFVRWCYCSDKAPPSCKQKSCEASFLYGLGWTEWLQISCSLAANHWKEKLKILWWTAAQVNKLTDSYLFFLFFSHILRLLPCALTCSAVATCMCNISSSKVEKSRNAQLQQTPSPAAVWCSLQTFWFK